MLKVQIAGWFAAGVFSRRVRPIDVAAEIGPGLAKATLAAEVDGKVVGAKHAAADRRRGFAAIVDEKRPRRPWP